MPYSFSLISADEWSSLPTYGWVHLPLELSSSITHDFTNYINRERDHNIYMVSTVLQNQYINKNLAANSYCNMVELNDAFITRQQEFVCGCG
jgi:hypothetical protein